MFPKGLIKEHAHNLYGRTYAFGIEHGDIKKFDEFYQKLEEKDPASLVDVEFFTYFTYKLERDGGRTLLQGMIQFVEKERFDDAENWFRATVGRYLEPEYFRLTNDPTGLYIYVTERREEVGNGRQFTFGEFTFGEFNYVRKRDPEYVKKAMFKYFLKGGVRGALLDHFPLTEILNMPVKKIQEEAQIRKEWLESQEKKDP